MKLVVLLISMLVCTSLFAQKQCKSKDEVPKIVQDAFAKDFPGAKDETWYRDRHHFYASFYDGAKMEFLAFYSDKAVLQFSRREINKADIPADVLAKIEAGIKAKGDRKYFKETKGDKFEYWVQIYSDKEVEMEIFNSDGSLFLDTHQKKHE